MHHFSPLAQVLEFRHPRVVASYRRNHPQTADRAEKLFTDMLKYLWLSSKHAVDRAAGTADLDFDFVMHDEMRDIDNMWHTFILYTQDYADFCQRYFGRFMHHQPDVAETSPQTAQEFQRDLEKYLAYVYDNLGERTVKDWFAMHVGA